MERIEQMAAEARAIGLPGWIAIKEKLAERAVLTMAGEPRTVLRGGAALHFAYGSPRLSADVDFVGLEAGAALADNGDSLCAAVADLVARPARWSLARNGRLVRVKVTVEMDAVRRLVLPVEAYEVPARRPRADVRLGAVEEPEEIAADKVVASADRLARRGALKTRDLFDLWYLRVRLAAPSPEPWLVALKASDYGQPQRGADLGAAARAVPIEEMREALRAVLPPAEAARLDVREVLETAALVLDEYRDVL